jgi:hypothetical protein
MRNGMANLSTGLPPQETVDEKIRTMLLAHRRPQKQTTRQDCTMLPDPEVSSGHELEW